MIVADTNLIAYLLISGDQGQTEKVVRLRAAEPHWVAPQLWADEFANILCTSERVGKLSPEQARKIADDAQALMQGREISVSMERTLTVARATGRSGYDSQYIALAEDLGIPLYTFDRQILAACPNLARLPE